MEFKVTLGFIHLFGFINLIYINVNTGTIEGHVMQAPHA